MASTITIRNLDDSVKQKLRVRAALHGRSMEAEVREILVQSVQQDAAETATKRFEHLAGLWKNRLSTDQVLHLTRGE